MEIQKTKKNSPPRILIHADHGVGKSSLGASAPNPLFIQTEDGLDNIETNALPMVEDYQMLLGQLKEIYEEDHDFQTLIIDSLDWAETLINKHVCQIGGKDSISDFGYGAGFQMTNDCFGKIIECLNLIRQDRGMIIILIAHSQVKTYQNPLGSDYDRHQIKLRDKNAELFLEWVDVAGFMHFQTFVKTEEKGGFQKDATKAIGGCDRILSCSPSAAYVAKNRYDIQTDIQLPTAVEGWNNLVNAIKGNI